METLTLVLTDVEGSTRLWADEPDAMYAAMRRHHEIVHGAVEEYGGLRPPDQGEGDAVFAAFTSPLAAVAAAAELQRRLYEETWPTSRPLRVRAGVHVGEVRVRAGNLFGDPVNRCARIRGAGSGGQTLVSSAVYELVRDGLPSETSLVDLGEHRLKDLVRNERLYQLDVAGVPSSFPPLTSLDRVTHNLPVQPTPFIGRERAVRGVMDAVREHRLVTLTGFGGMGKTRLALQAAAELAGDSEVGDVWFVDLTAIADPLLVPSCVVEVARIRHGGDPLEALVTTYADRAALLVLDNLEQVLDCAPFVVDLLARTTLLRILGTSREPLRVRAERIVVVPPLGLPDPDQAAVTEESLGTYEAVRLFLDRALAARADFAVTDANAPAVASICAKLEGSPLALELAAYRLKVLSVESLLKRLDAALQVLAGGGRDMPLRHQTLRATIAWSFDALNPDQQALLRQLSALPAPANLEMVEAVCGGHGDVVSLLEGLIDRSLVQVIDVDGDHHYRLLVAIRDYAAEQRSAEETQTLRDAHADYVTASLLSAADEDPVTGASRLVGSLLPHVRAALSHRRASPDQRFVDLVAAVEDGLVHHGLTSEYRRDVELAITMATSPAQLAMLHTCAVVGRIEPVAEHTRLAMEAAQESHDPEVVGDVAFVPLIGATTLGQFDEALAVYTEARSRISVSAQARMDLDVAHMVGLRLRYVDPDRAEQALRQQLATHDDPMLRIDLSWCMLDRGEVDQAARELEKVTTSKGFNADWQHLHRATLARLALLRGDLTESRDLITPSFEWFLAGGDSPPLTAQVLTDLDRAADDPASVIHAADRALSLGINLTCCEIGVLTWRRGRALLELGQDDTARHDLATAHQLLESDELQGPLELLGCLAAQALLIHRDHPTAAAALLATVAAQRRDWVMPHFADRDIATVEARLEGL